MLSVLALWGGALVAFGSPFSGGQNGDPPVSGSFSSLRCRDVEAPYTLGALAPKAVEQLDGTDELRPADFGVPTVAQAELVDRLRTSGAAFEVCALKSSSRVLLVRRQQSEDLNHCYGPPESCPQPRHVWLTCFETVDLATGRHEEPRDCLGYPATD